MQRGHLDDLRALVAVGRERSFTKAAAKLGVSQSALSQTIRQLEVRSASGSSPVPRAACRLPKQVSGSSNGGAAVSGN